ncbi:MAG: hypothetical protein H6807_11710 [Planctomycetes bacterium]|nr:hypothetical protein [Planctomycetota bacterium]
MNPLLRVLVVLALVGLAWFGYSRVRIEPNREPEVVVAGVDMPVVDHLPEMQLVSSESCAECHQAVFDEWRGSHHWFAWLNPEPRRKELSDNFRNKDCIPCHAPRPMLEVGFGQRPLEREDRREDGVNCFTCHKYQNAMLTPNGLGEGAAGAPCQPVTFEPLREMTLCAPCHDQHKVKQDWLRSRFAVEGPDRKDCNDCHMPWVDGSSTDGQGGRDRHRSHAFHGAHDPAMLKTAGSLRATKVAEGRPLAAAIKELSGRDFDPGGRQAGARTVLVEVANTGTGHNLPADERHRAVDVEVRWVPAVGEASPELRLARFRNPYRHEFELVNPFKDRAGEVLTFPVREGEFGFDTEQVRLLPVFNPERKVFYEESTQLAAGESRLIWFDLPEATSGRLEVRLYYKLQPYMSNNDAVTMAAVDLDF